MRIQRYFLVLLTMLTGMVARGQGQDFNPTTPEEPSAAYRLVLASDPEDAATLSGGGSYTVGKRITVKATATDAKWEFVNWTNTAGTVVSTNASFTYTTTNSRETLTAHFREVLIGELTLRVSPSSAGSVSGEGTYREGQSASVRTSGNRNFVFQCWKDAEGNVLSTNSSFSYVFPGADTQLTAYYTYNPGVPAEPSQTLAKHKVFLSSTPCNGSFSRSSGFVVDEGASYDVTAYNVNNFVFVGWKIDGETVSTDRTYSAKMGSADVYLQAQYSFQPGTPAEPSHTDGNEVALYGMSTKVYRGLPAVYSIYMENTVAVNELGFTLVLPEGLTIDTEAIQGTARTYGFAITAQPLDTEDPETGEVTESNSLYIRLTGGSQITGQNGKILDIPIIVGNEIADGDVLLDLQQASAAIVSDGRVVDAKTRSGILTIETLEESDIQALFSVDRLMNRAQFTNLSSDNALTFSWDFGDGETSTEASPMHSYAAAGSYNVRLTARGIVNENTVEQLVIINSPTSWVAEGEFTLDAEAQGLRNFQSLDEMAGLLSRCTLSKELQINVSEGDTYMAMFGEQMVTLTGKLEESDGRIRFVGKNSTINLLTADPVTVLKFILRAECVGVSLQVNGAAINLDLLKANPEQTICSGEKNLPLPFAMIGVGESASRFATTWTITAPEAVTGYVASGTGNLPSMTLLNSGSRTETVTIMAEITLDSVPVCTLPYYICVRPLLQNQTLAYESPKDGSYVNPGNVTLRWTNLSGLATGYTLHVEGSKDGEVVANLDEELTNNSYTFKVLPGVTYRWYVTAYGECDNLAGETQTFHVNELANLVVSSIEAPESGKGTSAVTVKATITNQGLADTQQTGWYDAIYWSEEDGNYSSATLLTSKWHSGRLAAGESYTTTFDITLPDATNDAIYLYVRTDSSNGESESDESDNVSQSGKMQLVYTYINEADYVSLKLLNQATNGEMWTHKWNILQNTVTSRNWTGVTFDEEGYVTAISLNSNNLQGDLPAGFSMSRLASLSLSGNQLTGDAAAFVAGCPALHSLNLNNNLLTELSGPLPSTITSLYLHDQQTSVNIGTLARQVWPISQEIDVQLTRLMQYNHEAQDFSAHPGFHLYTIQGGNYMGSLEYVDGAYRIQCSGDYRQSSGSEMRAQVSGGIASGSRLRGAMTWIAGDANTDGMTDISDAQHTINYILGRHSGNFNYYAADTYYDSRINVQDLVATVNIFLNDSTAIDGTEFDEEGSGSLVKSEDIFTQTSQVPAAWLSLHDGALWLDATEAVGALDITLQGVKPSQLALQLDSRRYMMIAKATQDGTRLAIVSLTGDELPVGQSQLIRLSGKAALKSAAASDLEAQRMTVGLGNDADGIDSIMAGAGGQAVYDLSGRRSIAPAKGIYIRGGRKMLVK